MMKKHKKYYLQFLLSLVFSFLFTLAKHYKVLPHSVRMPSYYQYATTFDFLFAVITLWFFLGLVIYIANIFDNRQIQLICTECEMTENVLKQDAKDQKCNKCGNEMVSLKGFYEKNKQSE